MSSTTTNSSTKSDYMKPLTNSSSTNQFDSTLSPLALLAQTCSSIGKDFPSTSTSSSSSSSSSVQKSTSVHSNSTTNSLKRSSPSDNSSMNPTKKSTNAMKTNLLSTPMSFIDSSYPLTNSFSLSSSSSSSASSSSSTAAAAALLLHSSLAYLSTQHHHPYSTSCSISGCYQCETSSQLCRYRCSYFPCNARFSTNEQLIEHIHLDHSSLFTKSALISSFRYQPYLKPPTQMFNSNDQLPYFYPYLSLTPMTETTRHTKKNSNNPN